MLIDDILDFLFPRFCVMCGKRLTTQEKHLCLPCYIHLPRTQYHTTEHSVMEKLFWGWEGLEGCRGCDGREGLEGCGGCDGREGLEGCREQPPIQHAVAFFHYNEENKKILLQLKYKKSPQIGTYMASQFVREILADGGTFFEGIDVIVPVPLHWLRYLKRSYNQSEYVAEGISELTGIPVCTKAVKRIKNNKSQTRMRHDQRRNNVKDIFRLTHPEMLKNKHILLVDDVTTTGSTISSCAVELAKAGNTKVSVLTIAIAGQTLTPPNNSASLPYISIKPDNLSKL